MDEHVSHRSALPDGALLPVWRPGVDGDIPDRYRADGVPELRLADRVALAYAGMLAQQPWHWFGHFTFDPKQERTKRGGVHPEKADKAFRLFVSSVNRELYGPRWHKKPHGGLMWARGQEFHKDGRIHFHAVLAAPTDDLNRLARRLSWMDWWFLHFGTARIQRPESVDQVCAYVSKYVAKGGEVDFSRNFAAWRVPQPVFLPAVEQARLVTV